MNFSIVEDVQRRFAGFERQYFIGKNGPQVECVVVNASPLPFVSLVYYSWPRGHPPQDFRRSATCFYITETRIECCEQPEILPRLQATHRILKESQEQFTKEFGHTLPLDRIIRLLARALQEKH
ncbi:MAG TPA: hypothetical protein VLJ21_01300 [Candidatus Binatia bacterium]|nr:hypothetical protein [Candidatus Binatia bacterium]